MGIMRNRGAAAMLEPPVVPGPDGTRRGSIPPCDACGTHGSAIRVPAVMDGGIVAVLCLDGHQCAIRYRHGVSPESYAAGLRGELLAVAP